MELKIPISSSSSSEVFSEPIKLVSCNVQFFRPDFAAICEEIDQINPDIIILQDAHSDRVSEAELRDRFPDYQIVHYRQFWVGSRFPIRYAGACRTYGNPKYPGWRHVSMVHFEIQGPAGVFSVYNLHQDSPREYLYDVSHLTVSEILNGKGQKLLAPRLSHRMEESRMIREYVEQTQSENPSIVVGDFNMTSSSSLYQRFWGDLQNTFDKAGFGYGYTVSCDTHNRWPTGVPWVRIDHILTTDHWDVVNAQVGSANGSDHRLVAATVRLKMVKPAPLDSENSSP